MRRSSVCCEAGTWKISTEWKDVFLTFIDLEKSHDTIDWHDM